MTGKQAKEFIIKNATPYFEEKGWKLKKVSRNEAIFLKKSINFTDRIGISTSDYNPEQLIGFGISKRIESVEKIMQIIHQAIPFKRPLEKDEASLYLLDEKEYIKREDKSYCTTEEDVIYNLNKIFNYLDNHALPLFDKFNDLREIDKLINGEGDNFWEDDWKKPFNLAHRFVFRRLIIAKLSGRNDYNAFIKKIKDNANRRAEENNRTIDWDDKSIGMIYLIDYLKNIEPLY